MSSFFSRFFILICVLRQEAWAANEKAAVPLAEEYKAFRDPQGDGWGTEAFYEEAKPQLKALGKLLSHPRDLDDEAVGGLLEENVSTSPLRPGLEERRTGRAMKVFRRTPAAGADLAGRAGFMAALGKMLEPWAGNAETLQTEFKLFKVRDLTEKSGTVEAYVFIAGQGNGEFIQQSSRWVVTLARTKEGPPLISRVTVADFEETRMPGTRRMMEDQTAAVLGGTEAWRGQFLRSLDYWRNRLIDRLGIYAAGLQGMSVGDANGDGLDDIYYCAEGGLPSRLLLQKADGTVEDSSASSGTDLLDTTRCSLFLDFDNDGDQDLAIVTSHTNVIFLSNDGTGRYVLRSAFKAAGHIQGISSVDYDNDGLLDLYLCCYNDAPEISDTMGAGTPLPFYDARNGLPNVMLRNNGSLIFKEVTGDIGLDDNNNRYSFACTWEDYDNDGDPDLYVVNDFGRKNLYRNDGGKFKDVAEEAGVLDHGPGMGAAWGDVNGDGLMDLHVANMFSGAGNRIAFQDQYLKDSAEARKWSQRFARGNSLFLNNGDGTFRDVAESAHCTFGRWAWGALLPDLDNDGWRDIVVPNGYITGEDPGDL